MSWTDHCCTTMYMERATSSAAHGWIWPTNDLPTPDEERQLRRSDVTERSIHRLQSLLAPCQSRFALVLARKRCSYIHVAFLRTDAEADLCARAKCTWLAMASSSCSAPLASSLWSATTSDSRKIWPHFLPPSSSGSQPDRKGWAYGRRSFRHMAGERAVCR